MFRSQRTFGLLKIAVVVAVLFASGCMSWEPGWEGIEKPTKTGDVSDLLTKANEQIGLADTKDKVVQLVKTYERVLEIDPTNYEALWSLGRYWWLVGFAYSDLVEYKEACYKRAIQYCERAMYGNSEFKSLVDMGENVWDACRVLSKDEIEAMFYWYAGVGSYWTECLSGPGRLLNMRWSGRLRKVVGRMMEIDPTWGGGHPYYAKAIYFTQAPGFLGGDLKKAAQFFDKAIEAGPNWLYIKWGRAKYYYTKTKDKEGFKEDLEWVIAQDPRKADSPYPANVMFQRQAKEMLSHLGNYF